MNWPGVYIYLTLWDPQRSDEELLVAAWKWLERSGARGMPMDFGESPVIRLWNAPPFLEPGSQTRLAVEEGDHPGGQVTLNVDEFWVCHVAREHRQPRAEVERLQADRYAAFYVAVDRMLEVVRPFLAAWPAEVPVDEMPTLDDDGSTVLTEGWVDVDRLDSVRREALAGVLGDALVPVGGGWRWTRVSDGRAKQIGDVLAGRLPPRAVPEADGADDERADIPPFFDLVFWAADRSDEQLLADVAAWAAAEGLSDDQVELSDQGDGPGWLPVRVDLFEFEELSWDRFDDLLAAGLDMLRRAAAAVRPSWIGLSPGPGFLVPGSFRDEFTGYLGDVWVRRSWVGDELLSELDAVADGAYREEVADGVLLVTEPGWAGVSIEWSDPDERIDRLQEVIEVLARAARASREPLRSTEFRWPWQEVLWFWAADRDDERLRADVAGWAAAEGLRPEWVELAELGDPGWRPVTVQLFGSEQPPSQEVLDRLTRDSLELLRRSAVAVRPSWVGLHVSDDLLIPGYPDGVAGTIENVWVRRDWIGEDLDELLEAEPGAYTEEVGDGVLLVTEPDQPGVSKDWWDKDTRAARVAEAAEVLGRAARASREPPAYEAPVLTWREA